MPAILDGEEAVSRWLDFGDIPTQEALKLIRPTENITFHAVSPIVNNSRNNSPECLTPVHLVVKKVGACHVALSLSLWHFLVPAFTPRSTLCLG